MTLEVARLILTLAIRLISRFVLYPSTGGPRAGKVSVDVRDVHHQPGARYIDGLWRSQLVLGGHSVKPYRCGPYTDFAMYRLAVGVPLNASGFEAERFNEEVVSRRDIAIHQHRDQPFKG